MRPIVIVGCGGQGREIHDIIDAINAVEPTWQVVGYLDDSPRLVDVERIAARGTRCLGSVDSALIDDAWSVVLGIGTGLVRHALEQKLLADPQSHMQFPTLVHPAATMGSLCTLGPGTVLWPGAGLTTNVRTGRHVHVNQNCTVGHDTVLEDFATLHPLSSISGDCRIGHAATCGTNSTVLHGLTVGSQSFVGAGACCTRAVMGDTNVVGVPARAMPLIPHAR